MDLCVAGPEMALQITNLMQQSVTHWEGLLWTTGGALVPDECFWYLIKQTWEQGKWTSKSAALRLICR